MKLKAIDYGCKELPKKAYYDDAGADVRSMERMRIQPMTIKKVRLGFGVEIPRGFAGYIEPRGSTSEKGIICLSPPIDSGYNGEIRAIVMNFTCNDLQIEVGDKIGQLVIRRQELFELSYDDEEKRGSNSFGSTGYNN